MHSKSNFFSDLTITLSAIKPVSWLKGIVYGGLMLGLYFPSVRVMIQWWNQDDYNYCYLVPPIVAYLIWEKRNQLVQIQNRPTWRGLPMVAGGLFLFWLGELGGEFYTIYISSWIVLSGLLLIHLGWQKFRIISFPIAFILTMYPPPNYINNNLSLKLKLISSQIGVKLMQYFGMSAYREGNIIDIGFTQLQVIDACSGLRYLIPLIVLGVLLSYFFHDALWKKIFLVFSTVPISILVNGLRIGLVGILYQFWGPVVAEGFFHDFSGWFIFMFSLCVLLVEMMLLKKIMQKTRSGNPLATQIVAESPILCDINTATSFNNKSVLDVFFLLSVLFLGINLFILQRVEFREKIPLKRSLDQFPLQIGRWTGSPQQIEDKFIRVLNFSDYIMIDYTDEKGKQINFYVAYYESQRKGESIHSPATCLPGSGWIFSNGGEINLTFEYRKQIPMSVNRAFIEKSGQRQLIYYWFLQRGRILTNIFQCKFYAFWDALTRQRTDGALIRIIAPIYSNETDADVETRLLLFTREIVPILDDFIPG